MPRTCLACQSDHNRTIDQKLRSGSGHTEISAWLAARGQPISRSAIGRHAAHIAMAPRKPGPRPISGDFLEMVRDSVASSVADGSLLPTVTHGLAAQSQLDDRAARQSDFDLTLKLAMILGGAAPRPVIEGSEYEEFEQRRLEDETAFDRLLLPSGQKE